MQSAKAGGPVHCLVLNHRAVLQMTLKLMNGCPHLMLCYQAFQPDMFLRWGCGPWLEKTLQVRSCDRDLIWALPSVQQ